VSMRSVSVRRALTDAPADRVVEAMRDAMRPAYGIEDADLLLVDYQMAALLPLVAGAAVTRPGDPAWRCFDHQTEVLADTVLYLPVTVRGERIGVLRCRPAPAAAGDRAELAELATALGHELQSASVGTDRYTMAARTRRLTLAAEMQWELLPGRARIRPSFGLAGQLEPSYAVHGDSFDWAEHDERLSLSVLNGMGEGMTAALLTSLTTYALRNARRAGLSLADQAALADQAVYAQHAGAAHVSALLLELDLAEGILSVVDAGSPRLVLLRDGEARTQRLDAQFPLGMFDSTDYRTELIQLRPGDRLIVLSDGITEAAAYGEVPLSRFLRRVGPMAPLEAVRTLLSDLRTHLGDNDLEDDAVAVVLDWSQPLT
jgi:serine phosphatase RsbU (regulator of sigma subunit)